MLLKENTCKHPIQISSFVNSNELLWVSISHLSERYRYTAEISSQGCMPYFVRFLVWDDEKNEPDGAIELEFILEEYDKYITYSSLMWSRNKETDYFCFVPNTIPIEEIPVEVHDESVICCS